MDLIITLHLFRLSDARYVCSRRDLFVCLMMAIYDWGPRPRIGEREVAVH